MVKLMNIGKDVNAIWCDYYPEGREDCGFIKVDIFQEEIIERTTAPYEKEKGTSMYAHHAMMRLIELKNADVLPKVTAAIWY